ncbi:MAG: hemolysin III family protein [Rhodanobacter sp.]
MKPLLMPAAGTSMMTREQTWGEELANSLSHGLGLLLAIAGLSVLVVQANHLGSGYAMAGALSFGGSAVLLYLTSTLYHAIPQRRIKAILRALDHIAIYLLIAGTYTPITLGVLRGGWGWALFGLIWGLALAGVLFKTLCGLRYPHLSTVLYVAMGWVGLIAIHPLWVHMAAGGLIWLSAGGLAYTLGVVFFVLDEKVRYSHFIWHLFVLAGTTCHFFAIFLYAF